MNWFKEANNKCTYHEWSGSKKLYDILHASLANLLIKSELTQSKVTITGKEWNDSKNQTKNVKWIDPK